MNKEEEIDLLKKVAKVDAPPFLMTRISAKIRAEKAEQLPFSWKWAGSLAFAALVFFNANLAKNENLTAAQSAETFATSLELQVSNQLYGE